jgi:hypothetical protein
MPQAIALAIGGFLFDFGAPLALVNAVALGGGTLITSAIIAGANVALNAALASQAGPNSALNTPDVKGSVRQPKPPKRVVYGQCRVGGALFFLEDSLPPYLYVGLLLSDRRISAVDAIYAGTTPVGFDATGAAATTPYAPSAGVRLYRSLRLGDPGQPEDPILAADFPALPSTFRQRGIAAAVLKAHYGVDYEEFVQLWGNVQIPNFLFDVRGAPLYDPRDPTQVMYSDPNDQAEVDAAMATWKYSNTAALVQADYLIQPYGARILPRRIGWDEVAEAAAYDEERVACKDGTTQQRYTIDGVVTMNQGRADVMSGMLSANRGFVVQNQGRVWVTSSRPLATQQGLPTIHDGMWVGQIQYRAASPKKNLVNRVRCTFVAPDREYNTVDGPILTDDALVAVDGELLEATIDLPFTTDHRRAQRLTKGYKIAARLGRTISGPLNLDILGVAAGMVVTVSSVLYPFMNGTYQVQVAGYSDDFSNIPVTLVEYDPTINGQWDAATDEQDFTIIDYDEAA